ncbi:hypothetical protein HBJ58_18390 [Halomonas desiderata]|uniref:hypothetical protein n=1 Tax=Billgrantia desiderata TaxID=52021 RepID=UPI00174C055C|nr:hypothetical protein [Halomonas desiderata]
MGNKKIQEILNAIEKDSAIEGTEYKNIQKIIERWESERKELTSDARLSEDAKEIINRNRSLLNAIVQLEKTEHRISKYSSSAALLGIIGAAAAAPILPGAVIPAAIISGIAALGGFAKKLKYEHDSIEKARLFLKQAECQEENSENGVT